MIFSTDFLIFIMVCPTKSSGCTWGWPNWTERKAWSRMVDHFPQYQEGVATTNLAAN
jgi:hypothetical protein